MSDSVFEVDAHIRSRRPEENLFGLIGDPISEQETQKNRQVEPTIQETAKEDYKWIAKGDTYPVKELLKKAGMLWDRQHREWYSNKKPDVRIEGIYIMRKKV